MQKTKLGCTEFMVSMLGFGAFKIGRNKKVKYPSGDGFELINDNKLCELVLKTKELGINLIDVAPAYGVAEKRIGDTLKKLKLRNQFIISTKVGEIFDGENSTYDFSKKHILKSVENSLKILGGECLEIVFLHCSKNDTEVLTSSDALETLEKLKTKGNIGAIGISTMSIEGGFLAADFADVLMVSFNPIYQDELPVIKNAKQKGKGIFLKKALLSGHIDSKFNVSSCLQTAINQTKANSVIFGTDKITHLVENAKIINAITNNKNA